MSSIASAALDSFVSGGYKLSMWIPSDLSGRVIGKKGVVIANIQRETKTRAISACQPVGGSLWAAVVISADKVEHAVQAYHAISDLVFGGKYTEPECL